MKYISLSHEIKIILVMTVTVILIHSQDILCVPLENDNVLN